MCGKLKIFELLNFLAKGTFTLAILAAISVRFSPSDAFERVNVL